MNKTLLHFITQIDIAACSIIYVHLLNIVIIMQIIIALLLISKQESRLNAYCCKKNINLNVYSTIHT